MLYRIYGPTDTLLLNCNISQSACSGLPPPEAPGSRLPRPEVRKYVDLYTEEQRKVLSVRPGITDYASIEYVDENTILGQADDADKVYVELILPDKIRYNMKYIEHRSVAEYFKIIFLTIWSIIH